MGGRCDSPLLALANPVLSQQVGAEVLLHHKRPSRKQTKGSGLITEEGQMATAAASFISVGFILSGGALKCYRMKVRESEFALFMPSQIFFFYT